MFINVIFGSFIFNLLGQNAIVLGLIVLLFIPLTVMLNVQEGVVTSCVILLHVFNAKVIGLHLIINEILLLIIGLGIAFLMNLIMPSLDNTLGNFKKEIENEIKTIFTQYSEACLNINKQLSISFDTLENNIRKAKSIAFRDVKITLCEMKTHIITILI